MLGGIIFQMCCTDDVRPRRPTGWALHRQHEADLVALKWFCSGVWCTPCTWWFAPHSCIMMEAARANEQTLLWAFVQVLLTSCYSAHRRVYVVDLLIAQGAWAEVGGDGVSKNRRV